MYLHERTFVFMFVKMIVIKEVRSLQSKSSEQVSIRHCLFCLKHVDENEVNTTGRRDVVGKRFFMFLNRYLSSCQSSRVPCSKSSRESDINLGVDFPICGDCFRTVEGFSELYKDLKLLELKMGLKIWKLKTIMVYAGRVPTRVSALKEYYKENGIPDKMHDVRKRIVKKCKSKLTNGFPRVSLTKCQGIQVSEPEQIRSKEKDKRDELLSRLQESLNVVCPTEEELMEVEAPKSRSKSKAKTSKNKLSKPRKSGRRSSAKISAIESDRMSTTTVETNIIPKHAVVPPQPSSTLGDINEVIPQPCYTLGDGNEAIPPPLPNLGEDVSGEPSASEKIFQLEPVLRSSDIHSVDVKLVQVEAVKTDVHEINTVWDEDDHFEDTLEYSAPPETEEEQAQLQTTKSLVPEHTTASNPGNNPSFPPTVSTDITTPPSQTRNPKSKSNKVSISTSSTSILNATDTSSKKMRSSPRKDQKRGSPNNEKSKSQNHNTGEEQSTYGFRSRFSCKKCSKTFANATSYESHEATHANEIISYDGININISDEEISLSLNERDTDYASQAIEKKVKFEVSNDTSDDSSSDSESCPETEDEVEDGGKNKTRKRKRGARKIHSKTYKKRFVRMGNFSCPLCSETFRYLKTLIIHQLNIHSEKSTKSRQNTIFSSLSEQEKEKVARLEIQIIEQKLANENAHVGEVALEKLRLNTYPCKVENCKEIFSFPEQLEIHSKFHGEFKCTFCDMVESFAPDLALHEMKHVKDNKSSNAEKDASESLESTQITTEEASANTTSDINMNEESLGENTTPTENNSRTEPQNKRKAFNNKPIEGCCYNCPRCPFRCISRQHLYVEHYLEKHLGLKMTQNMCSICKCEFNTNDTDTFRRSIESHYKTQHDLTGVEPSKIVRCTHCPAYFLTLQQLDLHSNSKHDDNYKTCKDCGKSFIGRKELRRHRKSVHKVELNVKCSEEGCDEKFETELELFYHVKYLHSATIQSFTCPVCKKSILGKGGLVNHIKSHKNPPKKLKPKTKNFVCEQCGKKFRTKEQLVAHGKSHAGPETWEFMCSTCSKKCLTKQKLDEHMRTHTNEKPFVCQYCGTKYGHRHNLRIHVNNKHGDITKDIPRAFDRTNLSSRKGIRRKANIMTSEQADSDSE